MGVVRINRSRVDPFVLVKSLFSFFTFFGPSSALVRFTISDLGLIPFDSVICGCNVICDGRYICSSVTEALRVHLVSDEAARVAEKSH